MRLKGGVCHACFLRVKRMEKAEPFLMSAANNLDPSDYLAHLPTLFPDSSTLPHLGSTLRQPSSILVNPSTPRQPSSTLPPETSLFNCSAKAEYLTFQRFTRVHRTEYSAERFITFTATTFTLQTDQHSSTLPQRGVLP